MKTFAKCAMFLWFTWTVGYTLSMAWLVCDHFTFAILVGICVIAECSVLQQIFFPPEREQ